MVEIVSSKAFNPFYAPLIVCGVAFCITACAYGVMTVRALQPSVATPASQAGEGLMAWLDERGFALMMWELLVLAILTFAAIGSDSFWERRHLTRSPNQTSDPAVGDRQGEETES